MSVVALATIEGPEARGQARLIQTDDGVVTVEIGEFWVASGAPDARLFVSQNAAGLVDDAAVDLGLVPDQETTLRRQLPPDVDPALLRSVIVHCKLYSVRFGYGMLTAPSARARSNWS